MKNIIKKLKKINISTRETNIICITIALWGLILIGSGLIMSTSNRTIIQKKYSINVNQKKVAESKTNEIKLKEMTLEINTPLSVDVKDYLENIQELDDSIIKALKLDTSRVNINEAGTYTYTVSFKKKKYSAKFIIKAKEIPQAAFTLKNVRLEVNTAISTNITSYINEPITDEIKKYMVLDLSAVKNYQVGDYQYTITYNKQIYTGIISIYEPTITVITPNTQVTPTPTPTPTPEVPQQPPQ